MKVKKKVITANTEMKMSKLKAGRRVTFAKFSNRPNQFKGTLRREAITITSLAPPLTYYGNMEEN